MKKCFLFSTLYIILATIGCEDFIPVDPGSSDLTKFSREMVSSSLHKVGIEDSITLQFFLDRDLIGNREAFRIHIKDRRINISGGGKAGMLYACMRVKQELEQNHSLPDSLNISDAPAMKWRGVSLQLMKLGKYNFAVTPDEFPFFYDKSLWIKFFDFLLEQRFNYIILWNGHPFDYFVKFDKYPESQAGLNDEQIRENHQMLKWLISESGKRNIKIFFEFYNIHTSVFFQEAHQLPDQISDPTPDLAAYTDYSISRFVREFPQIGLFVTPGEGLERKYSDDWINKVIFKSIKSTGYTPTVFMRAWFFDLKHARKIVDHYPDLHFVRKFNVEMIAGTQVDPENALWAGLNGNFIVNIHLAANLEPFRWNPPSYIQTIVKNNIAAGANGIHLHPRKAWRWPFGSDAGIDQYQWQRDTLFFNAWSRYAWNPNRQNDADYWTDLLQQRFGSKQAAVHFLRSFERGADVMPGLQRLIWLGYDNHTIVTAGATLLQLQNSKGIPFLSLKPTLRIAEYLPALISGKDFEGEKPLQFIAKKIIEAEESLAEARLAAQAASRNTTEAQRIVNDANAVLLTAEFYHDKLKALEYRTLAEAQIDPGRNSRRFLDYLDSSVAKFEKLCRITDNTYTSISDVPARHPLRLKKVPYHWNDLLEIYRKEYGIYAKDVNTKRDSSFYRPVLNGLAGIFFSDPGFVNAEEAYPASTIDFNWEGNQEIGRNWSVSWFGFLEAPDSGTVQIHLSSDRRAEVSLGTQNIVCDAGSGKEATEQITLIKGQIYPVKVHYDHPGGEGGFIRLQWTWPGKSREVIPGKFFRHSPAQLHQTSLLTELINVME